MSIAFTLGLTQLLTSCRYLGLPHTRFSAKDPVTRPASILRIVPMISALGLIAATPASARAPHSAIFSADRITTPLLLMTGGEDHNVPAINTREMYYALRRLGKPVTWVNYSNGGHGAPNTTESDITDWHQRILDWYAKYLSPPLPSQ